MLTIFHVRLSVRKGQYNFILSVGDCCLLFIELQSQNNLITSRLNEKLFNLYFEVFSHKLVLKIYIIGVDPTYLLLIL